MKKILFAVLLSFILIPLSVNAEECTDDMVALYLPQANNVYMQSVVTSNPDTYKIYVYGLSSGLSYDGINGTRYGDGYYAYATAGDTFTISIKISDGSICALRTVKSLSISVPANTTVTEPVLETTVPSDNGTSDNSTTTSPSTSTNSGITSSSSNNESSNSNTSNNSEIDDTTTSEDTKIDAITDANEKEIIEFQDNEEVLTSKDTSQKNNNAITKYIVILITIVSLSGIGIFIYFKKFKGAKK